MSDDVAIRVKNLGKRYKLGQQTSGYKTLGETITNAVKSPFKRLQQRKSSEDKEEAGTFWALKDVSFEVKKGEAIGIIGRNGAGKSTLLKILSRITSPTEGIVEINGRVGSLLEVGTGFHPELSGRENIFLSGSIMGMKKAEIDEKFDQIVKFAEIEKFLDTPVKRYSSGMYVRLAFAVAAHLEPEILIVDEVLAVGDAAFQKKCMGKMGDVANEGRTVLFVSHNMNAIEQLCKSCILLKNGEIAKQGSDVQSIISSYLFEDLKNITKSGWINNRNEFDNPSFKPLKFYLTDIFGDIHNNILNNNEDIWLTIEGEIQDLDIALQIGFAIFNSEGHFILLSNYNDKAEDAWPKLKMGLNKIKCQLPKRFLNQGAYRLELNVAIFNRYYICEPGKNAPSINFEIQGGLSDSPYWLSKRQGVVAPILNWEIVDNMDG